MANPLPNSNNTIFNAIFQEELNQAILNTPEDYFLSIIRFTIPTINIPLLIPQIQPFPNVDINKTIYSFTLSYEENVSPETFLEFVSENPSVYVPPISATSPNVTKTPYYFLYTYTSFVNMMNVALATAFAAIPGGAPAGALAPYFQYEIGEEHISLVAQVAYYDQTLANPIKIFSNYPMFTFLDGLLIIENNNLPPNQVAQYIVQNNHNNFYNPSYVTPVYPPLYYIMTQQYATLVDWNVFKSIVLVSNLLPVRQEYLPGVAGSNQSIVNSKGILQDFQPILVEGPEARTTIQYSVQGPYQCINMFGKNALRTIDVSVYWLDQFGDQYLLTIPFNQVLTIKMLFIKRSTYSS
jgi:hypothetical protein